MPKSVTLSSEDKAKVKKAVPSSSSTNKIVTATVARVYQAKEGSSNWNYAGAEGALVFCADKQKGGLWFRIIDLSGNQGVIWEHELPNEIEYNQEKPFFHTWIGDVAEFAFVFVSEAEAIDFYKKVANRGKYATKVKEEKKEKKEEKESTPTKKKKKKGKIDKSQISGPSAGTFRHVAHMGFDSEKGFSSVGVDPSWQALLEQLSAKGISAKDIQKNEQFIKDFVNQKGGIEKATAPQAPPLPPPIAPGGGAKKAPPPPAPTSRRKPAPAPPTPKRPDSVSVPTAPPPPPARSTPAASIAPIPPPPPPGGPPSRTMPIPPPPPPGPSRAAPTAPPPPPPPPPSGGAPRAPPPPPAPPGRGAPPPPPPPPGGAPRAAPGGADGGRSALLASIQGQGVHKLRKVDPSEQSVSPLAGGVAGAAAGAGAAAAVASTTDDSPDLASSLAAALAKRKDNLGDSDEEDSDDDWD